MRIHDLEEVFELQLKDLYDAERQLTKSLPKMAKAAHSRELTQAFEQHLSQTERHVERLEQIGRMLDLDLKGETCKAMKGLIAEGAELIRHNDPSDALDAALIAAAQRVEHYEIAAYGSACAYAKRLGHDDTGSLLRQTLGEEGATDKKLTELAEQSINQEAMTG